MTLRLWSHPDPDKDGRAVPVPPARDTRRGQRKRITSYRLSPITTDLLRKMLKALRARGYNYTASRFVTVAIHHICSCRDASRELIKLGKQKGG